MQTKPIRALAVDLPDDPPLEWMRRLHAAGFAVEWIPYDPEEPADPSTEFSLYQYDLVILSADMPAHPRLRHTLETIHRLDRDIEILAVTGCEPPPPTPEALPNFVRLVWDSPLLASEIRRAADGVDRLRMLTRLTEMANWINSTMDISEILRRTCEIVVRLFNVDHSGLVEFNEDRTFGRSVAEFPPDVLQQRTVGHRIRVSGIPIEEALVENGKIQEIPDLSSQAGFGEVGIILRSYGIRSILLCPIIVEGQVIASFSLDLIHSQRGFSELEKDLCQRLAEVAAVAIDNARLYEENASNAKSLRALFKSALGVLPNREPHQVLQSAVDNVNDEMGTWGVSVLILDERGERSDWVSAGYSDARKGYLSYRKKKPGITLKVFSEQQALFVDDINYMENPGEVNPRMISDGVKAFACLPLKARGRILGVMWVHFRQPHTFSKLECESFSYFARSLAALYVNASCLNKFMRSVTRAMRDVNRPRALRQAVVESARDLLGADSAVLWPYDDSENRLAAEDLAANGLDTELISRLRSSEPGGDMTRHWFESQGMAFSCSPVMLEEVLEPQLARVLNEAGLSGDHQAVRLEAGGRSLGLLIVLWRRRLEKDEAASSLLQEFAHYAAAILAQGEAAAHADRITEDAREITRTAAEGDLQKTLETVVRKARSLVGCDIATLYVYDPERRVFFDHLVAGRHQRGSVLSPDRLTPASAPFRMLDEPNGWRQAENTAEDTILNGGFVEVEKIRSSAGLVLRHTDEVVGVMFVNFRRHYRFSETDREDLEQFAASAALAIQPYIKVNERRRRAIDSLLEAGKAINESVGEDQTLPDTLAQICRHARDLLPEHLLVPGCLSHFALSDGRRLRFVAAANPNRLRRLQAKFPEIDLETDEKVGIVGRCLDKGRSQLVGDVHNDPDYRNYDDRVNSQISVPVRIGEHVIGVLSIEHRRQNAFSLEDQRNLELLGMLAGAAIANSRRMTLLKSLVSAGGLQAADADLETALKPTADAVRDVFAGDVVTIYTYDQEQRQISYPPVFSGVLRDPVAMRRLRTIRANSSRLRIDDLEGESVIKALVLHGKAVFAPDVRTDNVLGRGGFTAREGIVSAAGIPLMNPRRGDCVGLLFINHRRSHLFTPEEELEIRLFARYAAEAIETARRNEELRREGGIIGARTALAWMGIIRREWGHSITAYAYNHQDELALLRKQLPGLRLSAATRRDIETRIDRLSEGADRLLELPITPPLFAEEDMKSIDDLNRFIRDRVLNRYRQELKDRREQVVDFEFEPSGDILPVRAHADWLHYALRCLIENQRLSAGQHGRFWVRVERTGSDRRSAAVTVYAQDPAGAGSLDWQAIDSRGEIRRGRDTGLVTVEAVAEAHNGKLERPASLPSGWVVAPLRIILPLIDGEEAGE